MLTLQQVAAKMDERTGSGKPRPFRVTYVTADRPRKKGGEVRTLERAMLPKANGKTHLLTDRIINVRPLGLSSYVRIHFDLILWFNNEPVV